MRTVLVRPFALLLALTLFAVTLPSSATAATVTSTADSGTGSLREALALANDGDTIDFALTTPATIGLTSELFVDKNVTITGPGADALTITGNDLSRVFRIVPFTIATITDLTVADGDATSEPDGGGCIYNDGADLTLARIVVRNCVADYGGGILNDAAPGASTLRITDSTVRNNQTAGASGGGLYNDGTTNVATLEITRCTVSNNDAGGVNSTGGGIINSGFAGGTATLNLRGSTISGNSATGKGGGVSNTGDSNGHASAHIANSTFAGNGAVPSGGAIFNTVFASGTADVEIGNTILRAGAAGGTITNGTGTITSVGFNLASDAAGGDGTTAPGGNLNAPTDRRNTNPLIGSLQSNGGPTLTHAPIAGSPAIDQGRSDTIASLTDTVDQRGLPRPADDPAIANASGGDGSDIGAVEVQPSAPRDLAVTALKVAKNVTLKTGKPPVTKTIKVTIQNRGALNEVIPDLATLASLVVVQGTDLVAQGCAAPVATLVPGKPKFPATIKSKKKLTAVFSAVFSCAADPLKTTKKDPGHDDFEWVAKVDRGAALGAPDSHTEDDVCPRPSLPNGVDPNPNPAKPIKDKGCGGKLPDKTLGADVTTDVVVK